MEYKIEKGIEIPKQRSEFAEILQKMGYGDSILIPKSKMPNLMRIAHDLKIQITSRIMFNKQEKRVWRIKPENERN